LVRQQNQGPAAARNAGIRVAEAPLIVFVDDDVVPHPELVATHLNAHQGRSNLVAIGPLATPHDHRMSPWVAWEQTMLQRQYDAMDRGDYGATARQFYTGNASIERSLLLEIGGFDESFTRAEDIELAYRLAVRGIEFEFRTDAIGWHYAERTYESWARIALDYGCNDVLICRITRNDHLMASFIQAFRTSGTTKRRAVRIALRAPAAADLFGRTIGGLVKRFRHPGGRLTRSLLSVVYSMKYYQGFAGAIGGRERFWTLMTTWKLDGEPLFAGVERAVGT
jgi:GT2 family glycosyltransferase